MKLISFFAVAAALTGAATAAEARRVVNYAVANTELNAWAEEQGVAPLIPAPARSAHAIKLEFAPGLDHEVVRGGIFCSAWTVDNPITQLLSKAVANWSAAPGQADTVLRIESARTLSRCVATGELKATCITRVSLGGTVTSVAGAGRPVQAEVERATNSIGACAGLTRGIALVSREAVFALLGKVETEASAIR